MAIKQPRIIGKIVGGKFVPSSQLPKEEEQKPLDLRQSMTNYANRQQGISRLPVSSYLSSFQDRASQVAQRQQAQPIQSQPSFMSRLSAGLRETGKDLQYGIKNPLKTIKEIPRAIPKVGSTIAEFTYRPITRAALSTEATLAEPITGQKQIQTDINPISRFIFGKEPVTTYGEGAKQGAQILQRLGVVSEKTAKNPLAIAGLAVGSIGLDLTGFGSLEKTTAKKAVKELSEATTKQAVKEVAKKYSLKIPVNASENIAKTTSQSEIRNILKNQLPKIHAEDKAVMSDFTDYIAGEYKPANPQQLELDAARIAEHYGIKQSKTTKGLANEFGRVLEQQGFKRPKITPTETQKIGVPSKTVQPSEFQTLESLQKAPKSQKLSQEGISYVSDSTKLNKSQDISVTNLNRLNISDKGKELVKNAFEDIRPQIEQTIGKPLTHNEVIKKAATTSKLLTREIGRENTLEMGAQALNLRNQIAKMAESGKVTPEFLDFLKTDREFSANTARLLGQRAIGAEPKSMLQEVVSNVLKHVDNEDEILKVAQGVDFNDAQQAAEFYRTFVKPKTTEWIDLLRYNSMLSSPITHLVNIFSNLQNSALVAPLEKAIAGGFDFIGSKTTGKQRQMFAGEAGKFLQGYAKNTGEAYRRFIDVMSGKAVMTNLDLRNIPIATKGFKGGVVKTLSYPMRLLEGMDQFFTALTEGGERAALTYRVGKGVKVGNIASKAQEKAAYRLFRQDLYNKEQGPVLDAIDRMTAQLERLRNSENPIISTISKFTIPFIKTPTNIFKQGIEYSPLGVATVIGAANKTEQLAKAAVGSAVFGTAATMVASNRITWGEPVSEKQKNMFRAAGMQSYSVKIGDKWYSYQKLSPAVAFPFAMTAALNDLKQNKKVDDDTVDLILTGVAKYGQFLADQSYAKSIGDLLTAFKGGEAGISRLLSNYPQQLIPFRAMTGWMARLADDTQRKIDNKADFIDKQIQLLMLNYPGLSQKVPARLDAQGNPIPNLNRGINAISPVRITQEDEKLKNFFENYQDITKIQKELKAERERKSAEIRPIYDKAQQFLSQGDTQEAQKLVDSLTDEQYKIYSSIKSSEKAKKTQEGEINMVDTVQNVQNMLKSGQEQQAKDVVNAMTDEEYRIYKLTKTKLGIK